MFKPALVVRLFDARGEKRLRLPAALANQGAPYDIISNIQPANTFLCRIEKPLQHLAQTANT